MNWQKFHEDRSRVLKNLNEWTDNAILSDGTIGTISGSNADYPYDDEEYREYAELLGMKVCKVEVR